jgi:hypothetical protein
MAQLQPLVGVAVCQGLARTEAELMEEGCPMPEVSQARSAQPADVSATVITAATSTHGCVFAEACLTSPLAVTPATVVFGSMPRSGGIFRPATALHGADDLAPPIPPPNL